MECPRSYTAQASPAEATLVLQWLLSRAVALEYSDNADEYNQVSRLSSLHTAEPVLDVSSAEFRRHLEGLATSLGLPTDLDTASLINVRLERTIELAQAV